VIPPSMLVSGDLIDKPPSEGGCLLFGSDTGYAWCNRLSGAKVVGQFGDPDYSFIKVEIKAKVKDLTANGVTNPPFTTVSFVLPEIVGEDNKVVWTSMYYTFDVFNPIIKEIFFQRVDVEDAKGNVKQFTQYHHEFNRWDNPPDLQSLSPEDDLTVATLYLRATVASLKVKEWYPKGILDVLGAAGGFSTFLFFVGSVIYLLMHHVCPRRLRSYEELEVPVGMVVFDKFDKEAKVIPGAEVGMESASLSEKSSAKSVEV